MSEEREWGRAYIYMGYMHWIRPACPYTPTLHASLHCPSPQMLWGPLSLWLSIGFDKWEVPGEGTGTSLQYSFAWKIPWTGVTESDTTEQLHFHFSLSCIGEGNGNPLQGSCLENPRDGGAWWAAIYGVAQSRTRLSDFTFTFHFRALKKEMAAHSRVPAWRIPGMGEPGGLPSMGLHRVAHDWSDLAAAGAWRVRADHSESFHVLISSRWLSASFHLWRHLLPRGSLPTATWLPGHLLPLPRPERCHNGTPLFPTLVLHSGHVSFPEFHHLLVKRFFTKPSSGSVCHLFPLRTSMDAINKETRLLMNHLCRQNYGPLFRSS